MNDGWIFSPNYKKSYIKDPSSISGSIVRIPHSFESLPFSYFDEKIYQKKATYYKKICIATQYEGKSIIIHFEAVMSQAEVYLNGKHILTHQGGYTGFDVDISDKVKFGEDNDLIVVVDADESEKIPPFGDVIDYLTYSGIYREVYLKICNVQHIDRLFITPLSSESLKVKIFGFFKKESTFEIALIDRDSNILYVKNFKAESNCFNLDGFKAELWDLDNPVLYTLRVSITDENGKTLNTFSDRFGFRFVDITRDGFFLNGKKLKPLGLNRHQSFPYVGYAATKSLQELDADILKEELCTDIVRTSHYPNSKHFLNRCDEIGLIVITEIPGWQHVSEDVDWRNNCLTNVRDMIYEDFNHPSIIMWGVRINESLDDDNLYRETNKIAKELDPSRPTGGVRNSRDSNLMEDVFTYNDFCCEGGNRGLLPPKKVPYIVTEHNGHMHPCKIYDPEKDRVSQALRHLRVINDYMKYENIAALTGWCMSDYNTHKEFGAGDRICYHGVLDMFRNKKYAARVYESQSDEKVVLFPMHYFEPGDYDKMNVPFFYILTNCDSVKIFINGELCDTYFPDKKEFPYLKHPPVKVNGFLSNLGELKGKFSDKDIARLRRYFCEIHEKNSLEKVKIRTKLGLFSLMVKYRINQSELTKIYTKHNNLWIDKKIEIEMIGTLSGSDIIKKTIVRKTFDHVEIEVSKRQLIEGNTYDMAQVKIKCVDKYGNELPYLQKGFKLSCDSALEIIGPRYITSPGGISSFYVKTTGAIGKSKLLVESDDYRKVINFEIIKIDVQKI